MRFPCWLGLPGAFAVCIGCDAAPSPASSPAPYPPSEVIVGVEFDWSTHRREAPGSDNWPVTWGLEGQQYTSWGDGGGFGGTHDLNRVSLGFARIDGDRRSYAGLNVYGDSAEAAPFDGKSYGVLALSTHVYAWVSPGSNSSNYASATLLKSSDDGRSWTHTGVTFDRDRHGVILPAILNFGPGYSEARDEFVYHYFTELIDDVDLAIQRPGRVHLVRSPVHRIEDQASYQWFGGLDSTGQPRWTTDLEDRSPAFRDDRGVGWSLSVSYNRGLSRYLLMTEHDQTGRSNLGIFEAPEPWGPWKVAYYQSEWGLGEIERSVFYWNFANRWLSEDGLDFVLVFSGFGENDSWNTVEGRFVPSTPLAERQALP